MIEGWWTWTLEFAVPAGLRDGAVMLTELPVPDMALLRLFRESLGAVGRNPVILLVTGLIALFQLPQLVAQALGTLVAAVVSVVFSLAYIVAIPYVSGGLIGMADDALDGRTSLSRFHESGKRHYVAVFVAYLLLLVVNLIIGGGLFFVGFIVFVFVLAANLNTVAIVTIGLVAAVLALVYLIVFAFVQFYGQAIVIEDLGGIDGLKRSVSTVRANLLPVFIYTLVVGVAGGLFGLVAAAVSLVASPQPIPGLPLPEVSLPLIVIGTLAVVALTTVFMAVFLVFSVAFYRDLRVGETVSSDRRDDGTAEPSG